MIRVLLVDDSSVARRSFAQILATAGDITVVGEAADAFSARDQIVALKPDVMLLDIEMPKMDGITFLRRLMHYQPMPVVVCSTLTTKGGEKAFEAYEAGAADVIGKPNAGYTRAQLEIDLIAAVRSAALSRRARGSVPVSSAVELKKRNDIALVAIGASTGGTIAVEAIVKALPNNMPAMLIVQHMPAYITGPFAARLRSIARIDVVEASDGDPLRDGLALVAPGGKHMTLERVGVELRVRVREGPRVSGHCPSVDVMFHSVARVLGPDAVGVILTGMGRDGAEGLAAMHAGGAHTIAQDEATSIVFGMPRAAIELEAATEVAALGDIARQLVTALEYAPSARHAKRR
ncbi:MAG: chemotaxis response regulator protein-glutamate methylesterase [Pseudomonadota bacterium]